MKLQYRDENGHLTVTPHELRRLTEDAGREYYRIGNIYNYRRDGQEYVLTGITNDLMHFQTFGRGHLFIPGESCGTFLPGIADPDLTLELVEALDV